MPITTTLTLPINSATAAQGSHGGAAKASSTLTLVVEAVSRETRVPVSPAEEACSWISIVGPSLPGTKTPSQSPGGSHSESNSPVGSGGAEDPATDVLSPVGPENTGVPEFPAGAEFSSQWVQQQLL